MVFLRTPWFWLNCLVALLLTLPVPLISIEINGQETRRIPVYECYLKLFSGDFNQWNWIGVAIQFGVCIVMTALVYAVALRGGRADKAAFSAEEER